MREERREEERKKSYTDLETRKPAVGIWGQLLQDRQLWGYMSTQPITGQLLLLFKRPRVMFLYIFQFWAACVEVVIQGLLLGKIILSCVTFVFLLSNICFMM